MKLSTGRDFLLVATYLVLRIKKDSEVCETNNVNIMME